MTYLDVLMRTSFSEQISEKSWADDSHIAHTCSLRSLVGEVNEGDEIKKNIWHISGTVNEGDEIKITFNLNLKKLMRATLTLTEWRATL